MRNPAKMLLIPLLAASFACLACNPEEPPEVPSEKPAIVERDPLPQWIGDDTPEQINALKEMSPKKLVEFLDDFQRHPSLRVEALRLLIEKSESPSEFLPTLLKSLRAPTIREREAALYGFSRFGTPNHIVAIEASVEACEDCVDFSNLTCNCITYSVECTIKQILERASQK